MKLLNPTFLIFFALMITTVSPIYAQDAATREGQKAIEWRTRYYAGKPIKKFSEMYSKLKIKKQKFSSASAAVYEGMPYTGSDISVALALAPFEFRVVYGLGADSLPGDPMVTSVPAVTKDNVYVGFSNSNGSVFAAFTRDSGKLLWKYETKGPVLTTPLVHEKVVYFTTTNGHCYALNAETGKFKWKFNALSQAFSPAYDNDVIYIGTTSLRTYAIKATNGEQIWEYKAAGGQPTLGSAEVFVTNKVGSVVCLDRTTGEPVWHFKGDLMNGTTDLALANNTLVFGNSTQLVALDSRAGKSMKWSKSLTRPVVGAPIIVGDVVYVACSDWNLYAYELETGKLLTNADIGFSPESSPSFGKDGIFYPNNEQFLFLGEADAPYSAPTSVETKLDILYHAEYGQLEELKKAVTSANRNTINEAGKTPFILACEYGHLEVAQFLHSKGAKSDLQDNYGRTALMYAAWYDHQPVLKWLLSISTDVNEKDKKGLSALAHAAIEGVTESCKSLLENGAIVDLRDTSNATPLMHAAWEGKDETVELLMKRGATIDMQDNQGRTALILAAQFDHPMTCTLLLKKGANKSLKTKEGLTALEIAKENKYEGVTKILSGKK